MAEPPRDELAALITERDADGIEAARGRLTEADLVALAAFYFTRDRWDERCAVVELVQDHRHPALAAVMRDVLRCPGVGDEVEIPHAIALGWLWPDDDRFVVHLTDRAGLRCEVAAALARLGLVRDEAPPDPEPPPPRPTGAGLWDAARDGRVEAVLALLADGASPDEVRDGDPALCRALIEGHAEVARLLIAAGADPRSRRVTAGQTALWWAAGKGAEEVVRELLARGAEVDAADEWGATPLVQAASHGHAATVALLLAAGAEPDRRLNDGRSALHFAVRGGNPDVFDLLLDAGAPLEGRSGGFTPLGFACFEGTAKLVERLLARGADPHARTTAVGFHQATPLMIAAAGGRTAMVRSLLARGADPSDRDRFGRTAADHARRAGADALAARLDAAGRGASG